MRDNRGSEAGAKPGAVECCRPDRRDDLNLTDIDYLDQTWNPLAMRCTRVSPACDNCWHLRMAKRKAGNPRLSYLERQASAGLIPPVLMPDRIGEPLRLKKPQRIGVQMRYQGDPIRIDGPGR